MMSLASDKKERKLAFCARKIEISRLGLLSNHFSKLRVYNNIMNTKQNLKTKLTDRIIKYISSNSRANLNKCYYRLKQHNLVVKQQNLLKADKDLLNKEIYQNKVKETCKKIIEGQIRLMKHSYLTLNRNYTKSVNQQKTQNLQSEILMNRYKIILTQLKNNCMVKARLCFNMMSSNCNVFKQDQLKEKRVLSNLNSLMTNKLNRTNYEIYSNIKNHYNRERELENVNQSKVVLAQTQKEAKLRCITQKIEKNNMRNCEIV